MQLLYVICKTCINCTIFIEGHLKDWPSYAKCCQPHKIKSLLTHLLANFASTVKSVRSAFEYILYAVDVITDNIFWKNNKPEKCFVYSQHYLTFPSLLLWELHF